MVIRELKNGVDQRGKAKEIVNINCVVTVKLKGNKPLIFQVRTVKQVNKKGVVSFLRGLRAAHKPFMVKVNIEIVGLEVVNCFTRKGNVKGRTKRIQLSWWKLDVPGSNILRI